MYIFLVLLLLSPAGRTYASAGSRTVLELRRECPEEIDRCRVVDLVDNETLFEGPLKEAEDFMLEELKQRHGTGYPNLPLWTFGGRQTWADVYFYAGWRIQKNVYTGHHRLLDERARRQAWGSYEACRTVFEKQRVKENISPEHTHLVIIVHGLFRSRFHMSELTAAIKEAGYEAAAIDYPSTARSIGDHGRQLKKLILNYENADTVSFVTHSMGGLVVRSLFGEENWQRHLSPHRLVMIAPPNQGAEVARQLQYIPFYRQVTGPAGEQLVEEAKNLSIPEIEFGIIAGRLEDPVGFSPLITGKDDGLVGVENTKLEGSSDFRVITGHHNNLPYLEETKELVINFLKTGKF